MSSSDDSPGDLARRLRGLSAENALLREQITQLHRAKLAGDVLAGIAHDLGTALTGLVWCCEALQRRVRDDPDLAAGLVDFVGGAEYARALAQRLVELGKPLSGSTELLELGTTIASSMELLEMLRPGNVTLHKELAAGHLTVKGNRTQLQQVLLNLAANSFHAMRESGGALTVRVRRDEGAPDTAVLEVEDTGPGMAPKVAERALEPFFTTKEPSAGAGLGLSVVKAIAESHAGTLSLHTRPGKGTRICIGLPLAGEISEPSGRAS